MSSVETKQMSAVETGQMTAAETSVLSQQKKAQVQSWLTKVPVPSQNIKLSLKWVENRRFGLKLGPEACQDRSGAFGMGLTHSKGPSPAWSWRSKSRPKCRFGPKSSKMARIGSRNSLNRPFGLKLGPEACQDHSPAFGMGLTHSKGPSPAKK